MSDPNPSISNGTCYTARGEKLGGSFIPCGNDAFGRQTCCGAGDNCLADNACWGIHGSGYGSSLTYWAGCTDPAYEAATCPQKEFDQPWVALTLCDHSDGEWAICSQDGDPSTLQPGSYCSCTDAASATVAFSDANTLTSICALPQSTGQSIQFFAGHSPSSSLASSPATPSQSSASTTPSSSRSTSSRASSPATTTSSPTSTKETSTEASSSSITIFTSNSRTFTSTAASSTTPATAVAGGASGGSAHSGLSSGAKVGIGVGAGVGAVIVLGIIFAFFLRRRKRRKPAPPKVESGDYENDSKLTKPRPPDEPPKSPMPTAPPVYDADGQLMSEADGRPARPWTLRNELEGSQVPSKGEPPIAELPGSERFSGEQGPPHTLAHEANRQLGPEWKGPSLRLLNSGAGKQYMQSSS